MREITASERKERKRLFILSSVSVVAFFIIWECLIDFSIVPNAILASPVQVFDTFIDKLSNPNPDGGVLAAHLIVSLKEAFLGYLLALLTGIPLGLAMGWFRLMEGLFRPLFEMIRPIPALAWIPLVIYWFGIGLEGKVFIIWIGGFVPCVINAYEGVRATKPVLIKMAQTYGMSNWNIFLKVCIPSSMPMLFSAFEVALVCSWTCLVAAEMMASDSGLGFLITIGGRLLRPDLIILGMFCVGLTGVVIGILINMLSKKLLAGFRRNHG